MDYKTSFLPTSEATPEVCCRHRRLSRWAVAISIVALVHVFLHNFQSHYVSVEPYLATDSLFTFYDLQSENVASLCRLPEDTRESSVFVFTAPKETYNGVEVKQKGGKKISLKSGSVDVVVDNQVNETTIRVEAKYIDPEAIDYLDVYSDQSSDGVLYITIDVNSPSRRNRVCLQIDITVTLPGPSVLDSLVIGVPSSKITLADAGFVFSRALSLSVANGAITTNGASGGDISFSVANGRIEGDITTFSGKSLTATTANGHTNLNVTNITGPAEIRASTANGHTAVLLPDSFETQFRVSTIVGHVGIDSAYPEKIHYEGSRGFNSRTGYYGNPSEKTGSNLHVSSVNGHAQVTFVK